MFMFAVIRTDVQRRQQGGLAARAYRQEVGA